MGYDPLSIAEEQGLIRRGFEPLVEAGLAEVDTLAQVTPSKLHQRLSTTRYDAVHLIAHGEFDKVTDQGFVIFQDERVSALRLQQILCHRGLKLVFLNSCQSGTGSRADFNKGVAQALVAQGLPALVANQYSVLDTSATAFARHFYWALARGATIGAAACESRTAVSAASDSENLDWGVPVVYARDPEMRICEAVDRPAPELPLVAPRGMLRRRGIPAMRIAVWDLDAGFPGLDEVLARLNATQPRYTLVRADLAVQRSVRDAKQRLDPAGLARRLKYRARELEVDAIACLARRELTTANSSWWPADREPPVLVLSLDALEGLELVGALDFFFTSSEKPKMPKSNTRSATSGPLTLEEARKLTSRKPSAKQRGGRRGATVPVTPDGPSPEQVGKEREKLEDEYRAEMNARIAEFDDTFGLMKSHGVRRKGRGRRGGRATLTNPVRLLAEGDSWFDYPVPFFGGGVIKRLEKLVGLPILNLAKAGDEVRYMLGVKERKILIDQLKNHGPWDGVFFSGGGNDIVDNPMALWVNDYDPKASATQLINQGRFNDALGLVRAGYEDLIKLRDTLAPNAHLFFHGYDFAIPDGRGICHMGPWLKPTFDLRGYPTLKSGWDVVKEMLKQFANQVKLLSGPTITFVATQGTLAEVKSSWHNELHPSSSGFDLVAAKFELAVREQFDGRVP